MIRKANLNDVDDIYYWRNDPLSRSMSASKSTISIIEHKKWFKSSLINPNIKLYIGTTEGKKVGITRFDFDKSKNKAEVSVNLNPSMRGKKISFYLLSTSIGIYLKDKKVELTATVKKKNLASLKIFEKCGFLKNSEDSIFQYLFYSQKC